MVDLRGDPLCQEAARLSAGGADIGDSARQLAKFSGSDRKALEASRDAFARRLHARPDDWAATGALQLLNRTLVLVGWHDPYDWHGRFNRKWWIRP